MVFFGGSMWSMGSGGYQWPSALSVRWLNLRWELPTLDSSTRHLPSVRHWSRAPACREPHCQLPWRVRCDTAALILSKRVIMAQNRHHSVVHSFDLSKCRIQLRKVRMATESRLAPGLRPELFVSGGLQANNMWEDVVRSSGKIKPGVSRITDKPRWSFGMCVGECI